MSYIFRSDSIQPGERVVARRKYATEGAPGGARNVVYSDVIGHVISVNPLVIRPQQVGGYPSTLDAVTIPDDELHIIKKLSPRTVRNSDIRNVEVAYSKAFPGIEHTWSGQWLLRSGDGVTERSNSAAPLGPSAPFEPVPVDAIRDFYARHNLPPRVMIPERIGKPAQAMAEREGWELGPEIIVMTRSLDDLPELPESAVMSAALYDFDVTDQPDRDWLDMYHFRGQPLPEHALNLLRENIDGTMGFGRLTVAHGPDAGRTVAITRGTVTSAGRHTYLGYSAVEVAEDHRRRGLGTLLGIKMLAWGQSLSADTAYLQVIASNHAGVGLYEKLGFVEHHRHRYATLPAQD